MINNIEIPNGWNSINITPPDELVDVIDKNGNSGKAYPTYYPFKVVPHQNKVGKWTSDVVSCEPYWDGGWMIVCKALSSDIDNIIAWKLITKKNEK